MPWIPEPREAAELLHDDVDLVFLTDDDEDAYLSEG